MPAGGPDVIRMFELQNRRLQQITGDALQDLSQHKPVWVDYIAPTDEELALASKVFGIKLPSPEDTTDIEASARFFEGEYGELHIRSDFLLDTESESRNVGVAFVIYDDVLFSIHDQDLPVFRLLRRRARQQPGYIEDSMDVLLDLYATDAEYSADRLEDVYADLAAISRQVLDTKLSDERAGEMLSEIAQTEDVNGRIRRNVMDTRRALSFLMRKKLLNDLQFEEARQILRDIESLTGHTAFLFDKINFLMDAIVGFININQNKIVKIFSVASVALLPPTLIASIYGMNFRHFPELEWSFGYPFSLAIMLFSVAVPFWVFRRRGWLK
jgi:magnesium transporter